MKMFGSYYFPPTYPFLISLQGTPPGCT